MHPKLKWDPIFSLLFFLIISAAFIRLITTNLLSSIKREKSLHKKYTEISNAIDEAILICDEKGLILDANNAFKKMYEYDYTTNKIPYIQNFSSKNQKTDISIEFLKKIKESINQGFCIFEWNCHSLNKTEFWTEVTLKYTEIDGVYRIMAVIRNIHEQKKNREFMIQNEKIISLGGVAAGIAHEINNPLAGITQNTIVLERRLFGDLKANKNAAIESNFTTEQLHTYLNKREIKNFIDKIMTSANNAAKIVKNMLSFARKDNDDFKTIKISQVIEDTILLANNDFSITSKLTLKNIKIHKDIMGNEPDILAQPSKLQQVFFNIIKNSIEAMSDNPKQTDPEIQIKIYTKENRLYTELKDN